MAQEGDLLLVHVEDNPAFFARIECIEPDVKPNWYQVTLLVLQVPVVSVVWILRGEHINGASFTMGGRKVVLEKVESPVDKQALDHESKGEAGEGERPASTKEKGKVISLFPEKQG